MIDTEALRKKVIDLAIQGKLTKQLPEDGDAEDLYAQIQDEKAKLIKAGKIKRGKPLPEVSDDEIPFVVGKDTAPSPGFTIRTGFRFRPKGNHVLVKEYLSGFIHADKVAIDQVLSYHDIDVPYIIAIS